MSACIRPAEAFEFMPNDFFCRHQTEEIFGNDHPLEVDLGCGDGSFLLDMAQNYPDRNFLGVERLLGRVRTVSRGIEMRGLTNAKILRLESKYTLEYLLHEGSVSRLHLLCPDPWPKARHHKNRIVQQDFLHVVNKVLSTEGEFLFKTDHSGYFEWVCEEMQIFNKFSKLPWDDDSFYYPKTDFQRHWEKQGKKIHQLRYKK